MCWEVDPPNPTASLISCTCGFSRLEIDPSACFLPSLDVGPTLLEMEAYLKPLFHPIKFSDVTAIMTIELPSFPSHM